MLPEDINDLVVAFIALLVLSSIVFAIGQAKDNNAKISTENYNSNFEERIFLLNYLRTPVEKYGAEFTVADFVFMCEDKFDDLQDETNKIIKDYNKEINMVVLCNGERKLLVGSPISDERTSAILKEGYGFEVKMYPRGTLGLSYLPSPTGRGP